MSNRVLMDAETAESIGPATPDQIVASDDAGDTGIILIDGDGDVIGPWEEFEPGTVQPVRRVYVEE